jgi:hypothetical protein
MPLFLILPVVLLAFTLWCIYELVVVRRSKICLWLVLLFVGCAVLLSTRIDGTPVTRLLVQGWAYTLVGLPVYWMVRAIVREWRS